MSAGYETQLLLSRPYFTKKQLQRAQAQQITDRRIYNQKKLAVFKFLSDMCMQFKFPRKTLESAMYYYQRYHLFNRFETELCFTLATSCLVLSCKQVETIKKINEICTASLKLRSMTKISAEGLENFKKKTLQLELRILESCAFDSRVNNYVHIDEFIVKIGKHLGLGIEVAQLAWIVGYDALKLETLLIVPSHIISLAALRIASELLNKPFWNEDIFTKVECDRESTNEAYFDILNFYINLFDLCDLKENLPQYLQPISIDTFINIKQRAGPELGLTECDDENITRDTFLNVTLENTVRERRYVLVPELVLDELPKSNQ